jgi:hypothetical protein
MKYLSLIALLIALSVSWSLVHRKSDLSEGIHVGIQDDLKKIITDYIQKNLPQSKNVQFERMWTERLSKDKVKASFIYSFEEENEEVGPARVNIEGYAVLNKQPAEAERANVWSFDELYILNNNLVFQRELSITPATIKEE